MRVPSDWLNEYLSKPLDTQGLAEALERAGVEVEQIEYAKGIDKSIIVGQVKKVVQHPQADRLKLTQIDVGSRAELQIVCGAPYVEVSMKVAVALPGAVLPDGTQIKVASLRGVESQGMLCSARELGMGDDHAGLLPLDPALSVGKSLCDIWLSVDILDVTTPMNRSDLTGLVGLGREVAAQSGRTVELPTGSTAKASGEAPEAKLAAPELVKRFMAARVKLPATAASPAWLQRRLVAAGLRPINVVVDVTNYVMLEYGQPLHAFDAAKLQLPLVVRTAKTKEKITTLDGVKRELATEDLVIADQAGPVGLAGVMGGANSEISTDTTEIILEAATFAPANVRKTALRHGLRSDASARFERRLPTELPPLALGRALRLLKELTAAQVIGIADIGSPTATAERTVELAAPMASRLIGLPLTSHQMATELARLGLTAEAVGDEEMTVRIPWYRPDLDLAEDIVEEVVKLIGYDQVPATLPAWHPSRIEFDQRSDKIWRLKDRLAGLGHFEVATYSFVSAQQLERLGYELKQHLKLRNPLSAEQAYMRSDLLPSLLEAADRNQAFAKRFGLLEISKVFLSQGEGRVPLEPNHLAVLVRSADGAYAGVKQALDVIGRELGLDLEVKAEPQRAFNPARSAAVRLGTQPVGVIGEIDPRLLTQLKLDRVGYLEVNLDDLLAAATVRPYRQTSKFPPVKRDLTLLSPRAITWAEIEQVAGGDEMMQIEFGSDYYGLELPAGTKALTLHLELSAPDRTLTEAAADEAVQKLLQRLGKRFGIVLRGAA